MAHPASVKSAAPALHARPPDNTNPTRSGNRPARYVGDRGCRGRRLCRELQRPFEL